MRDLKKDFHDPEYNTLLSRCLNADAAKRPSSFTLLEISTQRVVEILRTKRLTFLSQHDDLNYHSQAVLDTVDRFFRTYFHVRNCRLEEGCLRLKRLIDDWEGRPEDLLRDLDLDRCPYLALSLCDRAKAVSILQSGHTKPKRPWNTFGMTPLHIAAREGFLDVATAWPYRHWSITASDERGRTPLHWACMNGHASICSLLLQQQILQDPQKASFGAFLGQQDSQGCTAPHRAAEAGEAEILKMMIEKGADVQVKDCEGSTPLHMAAANGHFAAVRVLIDHDSVLSDLDKEGFNPYESAMKAGYPSIGNYIHSVMKQKDIGAGIQLDAGSLQRAKV